MNKRYAVSLFFILYQIVLTVHSQPVSFYDVTLNTTQHQLTEVDCKKGLQKVFNRLKVGAKDFKNPVIQDTLAQPLVASYSFHQNQLTLHFNPNLINDLIKQTEEPLWLDRPSIWVWVKCMEDGVWWYPSLEEEPQLFDSIQKAAQDKGLTVFFFSASKSAFSDKLEHSSYQYSVAQHLFELSARQPSEAILFIELTHSSLDKTLSERWQAYYLGEVTMMGSGTVIKPTQEGALAMAGASQFFYEKKIGQPIPTHWHYVQINNVRTFEQFEWLKKYMEKLPGVVTARLNSVTDDAVLYKLDATISANLLDRRLARTFHAVSSDPTEGIMNYRLTL